jgi:hypothetical protein
LLARRSGLLQRNREGLADLFGQGEWSGTAPAGSNPTRQQFEALRQGPTGRIADAALLALVPQNVANSFEFEPRTQRGFKFVWGNWHVHGHEPDAGAAAGHAGAAGWVVRVQDRASREWLLAAPWQPQVPGQQPAPVDWSASRSGQVARLSHIPLDV